jgi:dihydroorotase
MPNTSPVTDSPKWVKYVQGQSDEKVRIYAAAAITRGLEGEELTDFYGLKEAGALALTDDGRPVSNPLLMKAALRLAQEAGLPVISHSEDLRFPYPAPAAEDSGVCRDVLLAEETGAPIHITHVSTAVALDFIRQAKKRGVKVTCDTAPHSFALNKESVKGNANFKMNPPLRSEDDRLAVIEAIKDGTVDAIVTDHAPHTAAEKSDFAKAPPGVIGLETSLGAALDVLYHKNGLPLERIVQLMSISPRRILGLPAEKRKIRVDLDMVWTVRADGFRSLSRNCPFDGMELRGKFIE